MKSLTDRVPPHSEELERSVLSACMTSKEALYEAVSRLKPEHLYKSVHQKIYKKILELETGDIVTLTEHLPDNYLDITGIACLAASKNSLNIHIDEILDRYAKRKTIESCIETIESCYDKDTKVSSITNNLHYNLYKAIEGHNNSEPQLVSDLIPETLTKLKEEHTKKTRDALTGLIDLDNILYMSNGDLVLIAARPSMGKSALASQIGRYNAVNLKKHVAIFSLEMSKHSLVSRDIFGEAGISLHDFRTGVLPKRDYPKIPIACEPLSEHPYWIDDQSSLSPIQLRSKCNYIKARTGLDLIIIDYLQLMSADGRHDSRRAEIEYISRSLKEIAKEFDVPLIALSQLSRGPEARKPPKPLLSDLRESGSIEQDADAVLFIYRAEQYSSKAEYKNRGELILAKQRNGPVGTVHVGYNKKSIKFFDLTKDDKDDITKHWSDDR